MMKRLYRHIPALVVGFMIGSLYPLAVGLCR